MRGKIYFLLPFLCCLSVNAYSFFRTGDQNADSILKKAKKYQDKYPDSAIAYSNRAYNLAKAKNENITVVKSLNLSALIYWGKRSYSTAEQYGQNSLRQAENLNIDSLKGDCWVILGLIDHSKGNYHAAIEKYLKSISFYKKDNKAFKIATSYLNIGICHNQLSNFNECIKNCLLAENYFESIKDDYDIADTYKTIASAFVSLADYPKAIEYNRKALILRQKLKDNQSIAQSYNNIGFAFKEFNKLDSSIAYLNKSIALYKKEKDSSLLILPLQNIGSALKMKGDLKKAKGYIRRSLVIAENYRMDEEFARGELDLGEVYLGQKDYVNGLKAATITENTAKKMKLPELLMNAYDIAYQLHDQQGDYKTALFYNNRKNKLQDSLFTIAKSRAVSELEIKYQTSQKEKDIAALNVQNTLGKKIVGQQKLSIILLLTAGALLLLLLGITYNSYRVKTKANEQIKTLMRDLHHRVKNNLQILSGLLSMQLVNTEDPGTRNTLLENEARLNAMNLIHNKLYLNDKDTQIEMRDYLTQLMNHIKNSFGDNNQGVITLRIEADQIKLEADKSVAIGLIVNELTTNAFKYAFDGKSGEIYLQLKKEGKSKLFLKLSDNGKGLSKKDKEKEQSFGLKLVNLMARQLGAVMTVESDNGTSYHFEISI